MGPKGAGRNSHNLGPEEVVLRRTPGCQKVSPRPGIRVQDHAQGHGENKQAVGPGGRTIEGLKQQATNRVLPPLGLQGESAHLRPASV